MNNVKNLCRVLCILVILVSFTNCQNDTVTEIQQEEALQKEFPFKTTLLTKQDIEANSKLSNQMRSLANLQSNSIGKSTYNETYGFTVDTEIVKFIEHTENNSHSYTFPIERENNTGSELENLVFTYDATLDDYTASLVTYHFSAEQKQEMLISGHISSSSYNMSYEPISVNIDDVMTKSSLLLPCTTNFTVYHLTPDTNETFLYSSTIGNVHNECQHEDANGDTTCTTYTTVSIDCPDGGSEGVQTGNPSDPTNGGGGNQNDENTPPDDTDNTNDNHHDIVTSPITKDKLQEITQIMNEAVGEGNWVINENEELPEDAPNFESVEDAEAFFDSLTNSNFEFESSEEDEQGNGIWEHHIMTFGSSPPANIKASVKRKIYPPGTLTIIQPSDILGVRTRLVGNTTIYNWTQLDDENISEAYSSPSVEINTQHNSLVIKVNAEMEYTTGVTGVSVTSVRSVIVEINYNLATGTLDPHFSHWYYDDGMNDD